MLRLQDSCEYGEINSCLYAQNSVFYIITTQEMFVEFLVKFCGMLFHKMQQWQKIQYLSKVSGFSVIVSKEDMLPICKSIEAVKWN